MRVCLPHRNQVEDDRASAALRAEASGSVNAYQGNQPMAKTYSLAGLDRRPVHTLDADVLVVGGGAAGLAAAVTAAPFHEAS